MERKGNSGERWGTLTHEVVHVEVISKSYRKFSMQMVFPLLEDENMVLLI